MSRSYPPTAALLFLAACSTTEVEHPRLVDSPLQANTELEDRGSLSLTIENDFFANKDNNYTSGAALQMTTRSIESYDEGSFYANILDGLSFLPFVGEESRKHNLRLALNHQIYTPTDIDTPNPPEDDQPYAGLLYLNVNLLARTERSQHDYGLLLGVIGSAAGAEQIQKYTHELVQTDDPKAWDTQLDNEPLINANYSFHYRLLPGSRSEDSFDWDLTASASGNLGTYMTGGALGLTGRFGYRLPNSYGAFGIQSGFTPNPVASDYSSDEWGAFLFVSVNGIGLAHFAPHGNIWHNSRSVNTEPLVAAGSIGGSIYRKGFLFSYAFTEQTDMFETQRRESRYGTLVFSCTF